MADGRDGERSSDWAETISANGEKTLADAHIVAGQIVAHLFDHYPNLTHRSAALALGEAKEIVERAETWLSQNAALGASEFLRQESCGPRSPGSRQ